VVDPVAFVPGSKVLSAPLLGSMDTVPVPLLRYMRRPDQSVSADTLVHKSAPIFSHYKGNDDDHVVVVVAATFIPHSTIQK